MGKRFVIYLLALVVVVSSVGFACPDVYAVSLLSHASFLTEKAMDRDPCRDMDNNASQSTCYRALHDRLYFSGTEFSFPGGHGDWVAADETPLASEFLFFSNLSTTPYQPPPKLALTLLYHVIRI